MVCEGQRWMGARYSVRGIYSAGILPDESGRIFDSIRRSLKPEMIPTNTTRLNLKVDSIIEL